MTRDHRQSGAEGDLLDSQHLLDVDRVDGAALDGEVPDDDQTAPPGDVADAAAHSLADLTKTAYNAQAIFALCSWPFSLKLLWAPIVDACFSKRFGRRKSWLVPIQLVAGALMIGGSDYVESELGLDNSALTAMSDAADDAANSMNVKGVTFFFFSLYFSIN